MRSLVPLFLRISTYVSVTFSVLFSQLGFSKSCPKPTDGPEKFNAVLEQAHINLDNLNSLSDEEKEFVISSYLVFRAGIDYTTAVEEARGMSKTQKDTFIRNCVGSKLLHKTGYKFNPS